MARFLTHQPQDGKSTLTGPWRRDAQQSFLSPASWRGEVARLFNRRPSARHHAERWKYIAGAFEGDAGDPAIFVHAMDEVVDRIELEFRPDPRNHRHVQGAAVEIAGKIEQKDFKQHHAGVEHRPAA